MLRFPQRYRPIAFRSRQTISKAPTPPDSISYPPKIVFSPSLEGYCNLFTTRTCQTSEYIQALGPPQGICDKVTRQREMVIAGASNYMTKPFTPEAIVAAVGALLEREAS